MLQLLPSLYIYIYTMHAPTIYIYCLLVNQYIHCIVYIYIIFEIYFSYIIPQVNASKSTITVGYPPNQTFTLPSL